MANYNIKDIYQGGYSTFSPNYGSVLNGYDVSAGELGLATDVRTANILQETSNKLQTGAKQIELSGVQPQVFESIPDKHLKEVNRLSKLTGVDITVHGPVVEASGLTQQGFNELARKGAERQMTNAVERSHQVNPDGNIPVTFHSAANIPAAEWKVEKGKEEKARIPVINQDSPSQIQYVETETRYQPGMSQEELKEGEIRTAEQRLQDLNNTQWEDQLDQLIAIKDRADRTLQEAEPLVRPVIEKIQSGEFSKKDLRPEQQEALDKFQNAGYEIHNIHRNLNSIFEKAYKYGNSEEKESLRNLSEQFGESLEKVSPYDYTNQSRIMQNLMSSLRNGFRPQIYKPVEDFAIDKSSESFANTAWNTYQKAKKEKWKGTPIISIENPPIGTGISRGEDLKKLAEESRKKFVEKAQKEGMSEDEAKKQAEKLIGVTWDVGHINMLRKYGYSDEDIAKQSEKVASLVKHVHLSDNFGYEHTELPMGMGNVPFKQIMERLGEKGFEAKKIIEAGNWWQHFKTPPLQETLEAFGSPIYGMKMQPYWNQATGFEQGYFGGYGQVLPQTNYETFGAGFSQLPMELGGQRPGGQGKRMSGKPME